MEKTQTFIDLWKKNNITECVMEFSCGGDSMGDYHFDFFTKEGVIRNDDITELENYFDTEVYNKVDFYVNSDGHYMGESGTVTITYEDDDDFTYSKTATSEFNEQCSETIEVTLSDKEVELIKEYVTNINGGSDDNKTINYKKDCILSEEDDVILDELLEKISDESADFDFDVDGEWNDWYAFTTDLNDENNEPIIEDNQLKVSVSKTFYIFRDSD